MLLVRSPRLVGSLWWDGVRFAVSWASDSDTYILRFFISSLRGMFLFSGVDNKITTTQMLLQDAV